MVLEPAIAIVARIVMIQERFISSQELAHGGFSNLYWLQGEKQEIRVIVVIKKDLVNKIMVYYRTDPIDLPYFMLLEIFELSSQ